MSTNNKIVDECRKDRDECQKLLATSERPAVRQKLEELLKELNKAITLASVDTSPQLLSATNASPPYGDSKLKDFVSLSEFAWDQTDDNVKVYVTIPNVGSISKDNVTVCFGSQDFDLRVLNLNRRNYRLNIRKLANSIDSKISAFKIKENSVTLTLKKSGRTWWSDLVLKESTLKKESKPAMDGDPSASIMNLMKNLYSEGDDDMKRTIAKAWTEANDKKMAGGAADDFMPRF